MAPTVGSLNTLYHGIANLDVSHFWTEGAKKTLLDSRSPFETEYESLKLDISDSPPPEYFFCSNCAFNRFRSVSVYYDILIGSCFGCGGTMSKEVVQKSSKVDAANGVEVFTKQTKSFIVSDDLHILPSETGLVRIIGILGITDTDNSKSIKVDLGFDEITCLLKASLTSPTPLSDVVLKITTLQVNSTIVRFQPKESYTTSGTFVLKLMIQKCTGRLLYAHVKKDFVEFLFSLLYIPLGGVEHLLKGKTCFKPMDNLYRSTSELIDDKCFSPRFANSQSMKSRLMKPNVVHGCISGRHILPLTQEPLPAHYNGNGKWCPSSEKFPNSFGSHLRGSQTYKVTDDLTVVPYCFVSTLSSLEEQKVPLSDIKEVEVRIGFEEGLSILRGSLTSTTALSHALFNHISNSN